MAMENRTKEQYSRNLMDGNHLLMSYVHSIFLSVVLSDILHYMGSQKYLSLFYRLETKLSEKLRPFTEWKL